MQELILTYTSKLRRVLDNNKMKIHLRDVKILCELFKSVSPETPRRIDTILEYAKQMGLGKNAEESQMVYFATSGANNDEKFTPQRETLIKLSQNLSLLIREQRGG